MCGILGIIGHRDIAGTLLEGLTSIQHRGQDAAGIVTFNHRFHLHKADGLVGQAFKNLDLEKFQGRCGLGHVRYATQGSTDVLDAQPTVVNYPFGLAMVHNGNVVNFNQLKQTLCEDRHRLLDTSNDVALILYALAAALETKNLQNLSPDDIFDSVRTVQEQVQGAYSALTIIANHGLLAFTDPYGIRPLVFGRKYTDQGMVYAFASESDCFDYLGFEMIRDLRPGEAVLIDNEGKVHSRTCLEERQAFCVFEYIYFAREDSVINGRLVASERVRIGRQLAEQIKKAGLEPDLVIDVPSSAYFFASGMAEALGSREREASTLARLAGSPATTAGKLISSARPTTPSSPSSVSIASGPSSAPGVSSGVEGTHEGTVAITSNGKPAARFSSQRTPGTPATLATSCGSHTTAVTPWGSTVSA